MEFILENCERLDQHEYTESKTKIPANQWNCRTKLDPRWHLAEWRIPLLVAPVAYLATLSTYTAMDFYSRRQESVAVALYMKWYAGCSKLFKLNENRFLVCNLLSQKDLKSSDKPFKTQQIVSISRYINTINHFFGCILSRCYIALFFGEHLLFGRLQNTK